MNIVVVGAQWGDEGKGKLIDFLSQEADVTVRFQGGNNAGHTVVVGEESHVFHLLPSAILHKGKICALGNGVVVDPRALLNEIAELRKRGVDVSPRRLKISGRSHVVMPYHRVLDGLRESRRVNRIGTTGRGIGPCYADKVARCGIRMVDLGNPSVLKSKLEDNIREKNAIFRKVYGFKEFSFDGVYKEYLRYGRALRDYICDVALFLNREVAPRGSILFEGAQGAFLDIDFGTYPFVTSSNCIVGGVSAGTGFPPTKIDKAIAAAKAYTTRVGEGPFPTEFSSRMGEEIQTRGQEFGATTGRPRRCGWFDAVQVRYSVMLNGVRELAIMKLDVLDGLKEIKVCVGYRVRGRVVQDFPLDYSDLVGARPVYESLPGWKSPTQGLTSYRRLPVEARRYITRLEQWLGVRITYISTGSRRDEIIVRR